VPPAEQPRREPAAPVRTSAADQTPPWDQDIPIVDDEPTYVQDAPFDLPDERPARVTTPQRSAPEPGTPVPAALSVPERTVVPVVPTTPLGDRWADLVARMQQEGLLAALVRELAMQAECVGVQEDGGASVWTLRVERETLRSDTQRERLTAAVRKVLGDEASIALEAGVAKDTPALREQAARAGRQAAAEALIQQDPLVNALLAQYPGARIVGGSIAPL
jgi:DNA polymerase-3 subunit gamma/tau